MADLIERQTLLSHIKSKRNGYYLNWYDHRIRAEELDAVTEIINAQPVAQGWPVGYWIETPERYCQCPYCGELYMSPYNFCSECGAKLKEDGAAE